MTNHEHRRRTVNNETTLGEIAAKTVTYSGAAVALTLQQWSGVIIGLLGLFLTFWLGYRKDQRDRRHDERLEEEHQARLIEIKNSPDRRAQSL